MTAQCGKTLANETVCTLSLQKMRTTHDDDDDDSDSDDDDDYFASAAVAVDSSHMASFAS